MHSTVEGRTVVTYSTLLFVMMGILFSYSKQTQHGFMFMHVALRPHPLSSDLSSFGAGCVHEI